MYLREFTQEGIVDAAVQFHRELNPKLWNGKVLKPIVRYKLLEIARHFIEFIDIPNLRLKDVTISGSNAAYSYTAQSDIDLHLVVDVPEQQEKLLKPLYDAKKNQYNYNHDIKIKDIDVELYVQPSTDKHHSLGICSVKINDSDVQLKVDNYLNKIMQALTSDELATAKDIQQEISKIRQSGLEQGGEFSIENVAYKVLRAKGFIEQLRQHIYKLQDKELSLGEQK